MLKIDVNVDMGESFGRYILGDDESIMPYISSANVATGFHAGDPLVIHRTVKWAKEHNVAVGAHVGLPDKQGFGRREMKITPEELISDTIFQLGALDAFLKLENMTMQHIKPHGILYRMVSEYEEYIDPFLDAVEAYNKKLFIMFPPNTLGFKRGVERGFLMAPEILIDLSYDEEGNWIIERTKKARTPEEVAARAVMVAKDKQIETMSGKRIPADGVTVCLHGDSPNALDIAKVVKKALEDNDITLANLSL